MKILAILLLMTNIVYADVVLYRYTDKITSKERGVCYSDKDGNPAINNPDWNSEIISEDKKEFYISKQQQELKQEQQQAQAELKAKRKIIKDKLKAGTPLSQEDVNILVGESD